MAVVGLGPAGRALAHRCRARGLSVAAIDPRADAPWRPTYGVWADELPAWLPRSVTASLTRRPAVRTDSGLLRIDRAYAVLDNARFREALALEGAAVFPARAGRLTRHTVFLPDGVFVGARFVVDARGLPRTPSVPEQTAFGVFVDAERARPVLAGEDAVFMDWSTWGATAPATPPSFLYAVPVGGGRVLLEETCLAGSPPIPIGELRARLSGRMREHGVTLTEGDAVERVRFSLGGGATAMRRPGHRGVLRFGSRGGLMHPATGYSVGASLGAADAVAGTIAVGRGPASPARQRGALAVRALRRRSARVTTALPPEALPEFFDAFFRLPPHRQCAYLSETRHALPVLAAMVDVYRRLPASTRRVLRAETVRHR